ncbi:SPOR domain-containing protein [Methylococcus capsulatus]|uniref:SPOR domain-containing protein n=1 Tax=Methylococcus capsulatus TaxID=414 RepID=UPI001C533E24|nr:SPOR domain-containing protein [Methylococcus capsulatus]QXP86938.1 SPOR domain-containing protein [Methylococcus capsulatus]QXP93382.1 SPOR domain-containing protein [Methylococcus capsulatus]
MDEQLKQRLIGATVIVALAVIFVPMLFDEKPGPSRPEVAEIPPMPKDMEEQPVELPRSVEEVATAEPVEAEGADRIIPITGGEDGVAGAGTVPPSPKRGAVPQKEKPGQPVEPEQAPADGFVEEDMAPMEAAPTVKPTVRPSVPKKMPAATAVPAATGGKPPAKAGSAEPALRKPEVPPAAAPAAGVSAWLVQAGSFVEEANAKALVEKLRQNNLSAYAETVHGSTGKVTYRVRIGPEPDKARAEQVLRQLESVAGIRGYLVPSRPR